MAREERTDGPNIKRHPGRSRDPRQGGQVGSRRASASQRKFVTRLQGGFNGHSHRFSDGLDMGFRPVAKSHGSQIRQMDAEMRAAFPTHARVGVEQRPQALQQGEQKDENAARDHIESARE